MTNTTDPRLDVSAIRARYNDLSNYVKIDKWHLFTATEIDREIVSYWNSLSDRSAYLVLNAGAGGHDLDLTASTTINLDISETRLAPLPHPLLASVENLPLADASVDAIICVGSVINYCDAAVTIMEFARVLKVGGSLILEFDSSQSAELITQQAFGQSAAIAETFYAGQDEAVWVYSAEYVENLLRAARFDLIHRVAIHVLSPWSLLLLRNLRAAAAIARLDRIARRIPFLTRWASNHLFFCEKKTLPMK